MTKERCAWLGSCSFAVVLIEVDAAFPRSMVEVKVVVAELVLVIVSVSGS